MGDKAAPHETKGSVFATLSGRRREPAGTALLDTPAGRIQISVDPRSGKLRIASHAN
ncbi:MAG: hypothetical protein HZA21_01180 [Nitrospirae bacterium]|nr:hypothetical protein [Nitrospirota bacterium]